MRVVEEPFVTRDTVLSVLRPGDVTTERPFRTLRHRDAASAGLPVTMRVRGQVVGRLHLYSALNGDAARAYRLREVGLAKDLAARATEIEQSPEASLIHRAVAAVAMAMPVDPLAPDAPAGLRRYVELRRRSSWRGLDPAGLSRDWLVHSEAWLTANDDALGEAIVALSQAAEEARAGLLGNDARSVTTFFGIVSRMDPIAAEIEADGEALLVPREDLERQGLAVLGQAVALLREEMPGGGSYSLPISAVGLDRPIEEPPVPVLEHDFPEDEGIRAIPTLSRDTAWLDRELSREPTAVPAAPLRVA